MRNSRFGILICVSNFMFPQLAYASDIIPDETIRQNFWDIYQNNEYIRDVEYEGVTQEELESMQYVKYLLLLDDGALMKSNPNPKSVYDMTSVQGELVLGFLSGQLAQISYHRIVPDTKMPELPQLGNPLNQEDVNVDQLAVIQFHNAIQRILGENSNAQAAIYYGSPNGDLLSIMIEKDEYLLLPEPAEYSGLYDTRIGNEFGLVSVDIQKAARKMYPFRAVWVIGTEEERTALLISLEETGDSIYNRDATVLQPFLRRVKKESGNGILQEYFPLVATEIFLITIGVLLYLYRRKIKAKRRG